MADRGDDGVLRRRAGGHLAEVLGEAVGRRSVVSATCAGPVAPGCVDDVVGEPAEGVDGIHVAAPLGRQQDRAPVVGRAVLAGDACADAVALGDLVGDRVVDGAHVPLPTSHGPGCAGSSVPAAARCRTRAVGGR